MVKSARIVETQQEQRIALQEVAIRELLAQNGELAFRLEEHLSALDSMMDRNGNKWIPLGAYQDSTGPSLAQLKERAAILREMVAVEPIMQNGARLLGSYVWSDPISYENVPGLIDNMPVGRGARDGVGRGKRNVGAFVLDPWNQAQVFGPSARLERSRSLFTSGAYLVYGVDSTRKCRPVPLERVTGFYANPDWDDEVWAYRLSWFRMNSDGTQGEERVEWVFTDQHKDKQTSWVQYNGKREPVNRGATIIDGWVNRQVGWRFGFPHGGAVIEWVAQYNRFIRSGLDMNAAMASIWATAKKDAAAGVQNTAAKLAGVGPGSVAVGTGVDLNVMSTAGKAYDFKAGVPVLARVAQGLGISVVALSQSPGDSGSSYGAAETLDLPTRLNIEQHRMWNCEFDERILRWMGAPDALATFPPIVDATETYRLMQSAQLAWTSGLFGAEEAKKLFVAPYGNRGEIQPIPDGVLIPNNESSVAIGMQPSAAAPGQGQSTGVGDVPASGDTRTDTIS